MSFPLIYLARHGQTAWSITGQHTGRTDIPLTAEGEENARQLGERLHNTALTTSSSRYVEANEQPIVFTNVLSSPLQRAMKTGTLAEFNPTPEPLLLEWDYGQYEALTTKEIQEVHPDWQIFRDGCPGGESPNQVAARCDELIQKIRTLEGNTLLFAHAHILRMLATRWLGLSPDKGRLYFLNTASLSILGYEHHMEDPVIHLWNETSHLH